MAKKPQQPARRGRPSSYSEAVADEICARLAGGASLVTICKDEAMPGRRTVLDWLDDDKHDSFRTKYARARDAQADLLAAQIVDIADTPLMGVKTKTNDRGEVETTEGDMIEHRRLQVDARKWYASKLAPKKYGDRQEITGKDGAPLIPESPPTDNEIGRRIAFLLTRAIKETQ